MFLTLKYHFKPSPYQYNLLKLLFHISKNIYNSALYKLRSQFFDNKKICSYFELNKIMKSNENFHILNTYASICTIRCAHNNMMKFVKKKSKMPSYLSKCAMYPIYTDQVRIINVDGKDVIKLPLSNTCRTNKIFKEKYKDELINKFIEESKLEKIENIYFPVPNKIKNNKIHQVRIVPKCNGRWIEVEFSYEKEIEEAIVTDSDYESLAIDIGINNLASCICTNNDSFIIDGRKLKSINQFFNKQRAYYQSKSKNNKYTKRLNYLQLRNKLKVEDYLNKAAITIIKKAKKLNVMEIIIGYNKGLKTNGIKNEEITNKVKRQINQSFVSLPLSRFVNKIAQKCKEHGIKCVIANESYTSKASFYDGDEVKKSNEYSGKRIKRGLYQTLNKKIVNADINGALNILAKSKPKDDLKINYLRYRGLTVPKRIQVRL